MPKGLAKMPVNTKKSEAHCALATWDHFVVVEAEDGLVLWDGSAENAGKISILDGPTQDKQAGKLLMEMFCRLDWSDLGRGWPSLPMGGYFGGGKFFFTRFE